MGVGLLLGFLTTQWEIRKQNVPLISNARLKPKRNKKMKNFFLFFIFAGLR
jgi:hypothetical protein